MSAIKRRSIVKDDLGNHYAVDNVNTDGSLNLHSVATKECWDDVPAADVVLVEGLVEA